MRILVCGGRDYTDAKAILDYLQRLNDEIVISHVIHGDAQGADKLAGAMASAMGIPVTSYPANWGKYGNSAGPIRNKQMLDEGKPDLIVAFQGKTGTSNMTTLAKRRLIPVLWPDSPNPKRWPQLVNELKDYEFKNLLRAATRDDLRSKRKKR